MPRTLESEPSTNAPPPQSPPPRYYQYDPNLGGARDKYTRADLVHRTARQPEVPALFVAVVEGQTNINTMWGRRTVAWRAEPGTPCIIQGYWSDGTVHLRWPAIAGHYSVDGRFPAWVVTVDEHAILAGGGRILYANDPPRLRPGLPVRLVLTAVIVAIVVLLLVVPPTRDALLGLASDLLQQPR